MSGEAHWENELRSVLLLLLLATLLGWLAGHLLLFVSAVLAGILAYYLLQLYRIHKWLSAPEETPPKSKGLWGDVFDEIHHLQRRNLEAQSRLQFSVDHLRDSFSSMRDGVVMLDKEGAIEWSNTSSETLLGLRFPSDKGQSILDLVRAPEFNQYFMGEDFKKPLYLETSSDSGICLRLDISCFGEGDRLMFIRDVSKMQRLEQVRKDFVGNVSHELRTPLTVISGYLGIMLDAGDAVDSRFRKPLLQMELQAKRMESLLKDLLWLSRLESVQNTDRDELVDIPALLQEIQVELQESYPERKIEVALETSQKIPGDRRELHSAVSNLIQNALKYSPASSPVCVSWTNEEEYSLLSVIDQGTGIEAAHIPRLTERFYRVDDSRSSSTGGTGLGLAIVKHVAAGHNAELRIESVVGLGSKFILVFSQGR